jgi:hypothetical protein
MQRHTVDPVTDLDRPPSHLTSPKIRPLKTADCVALLAWQVLHLDFRKLTEAFG